MWIDYHEGIYFAGCTYEQRLIFRESGWEFSAVRKRWETRNDDLGALFMDCARPAAFDRLSGIAAVNAALISASSAVDTDTEFWCPVNKKYLGFQKAGIEFMLARHHVLLADSPGLGKTVQVLGFISNSGVQNAIIIVPAYLKYNWLREAKRWLPDRFTIGITDVKVLTKTKEREASRTHVWPNTDIVITTYDALEEHHDKLREKVWDVEVCDEAHELSNPTSIRTRNVLGGGRGKSKILAIPTKKTIFLTGTPITKRPINLWPMVQKCDPKGLGRDYRAFVRRYCGGYDGPFGLYKDGATNLEELQFKLRSVFMIRRMKDNVLKELPPKVRQVVELPPEGTRKLVKKELAQFEKNLERMERVNAGEEYDESVFDSVSFEALSKFIDEATEKAVAYSSLENGEVDLEDYLKLHFEAMSLAREEVGLAKVPMVAEYVRRLLDTDEKVVIMTFHKSVAAELLKIFPGSAFVTGSVGLKKRDKEVDRFQEDPNCRVFIGNIGAAGTGITLTAAVHLVFAELDWSPADMEQAEDRIHRIGQEFVAFIHYLVIRGSMEAGMVGILIEKQEIISIALNT